MMFIKTFSVAVLIKFIPLPAATFASGSIIIPKCENNFISNEQKARLFRDGLSCFNASSTRQHVAARRRDAHALRFEPRDGAFDFGFFAA